ncbi:hypothetical protein D918_03936 [Trichuris suis]|nr:hypothetical protein D918_03936 [Trichuris suis]
MSFFDLTAGEHCFNYLFNLLALLNETSDEFGHFAKLSHYGPNFLFHVRKKMFPYGLTAYLSVGILPEPKRSLKADFQLLKSASFEFPLRAAYSKVATVRRHPSVLSPLRLPKWHHWKIAKLCRVGLRFSAALRCAEFSIQALDEFGLAGLDGEQSTRKRICISTGHSWSIKVISKLTEAVVKV